MSAHTPGPWTVHDGDDFDGGLIVYCAGTPFIPNPSQCALTINVGEGVEEGDKGWPTVEANAHLIAAAPEMLEALHEARLQLEYLADKFQPTGSGASVLAKISAAIAKAEGRS